MKIAATTIVLLFAGSVGAQSLPSVADHETKWNQYLAGKLQATTPVLLDGSLPDLVFDGYAVEVDWAERKWREAIGQSFLYAELSNNRPGVLLLVKDREAEKMELLRAYIACRAAGVRLWVFDCKRGVFIRY